MKQLTLEYIGHSREEGNKICYKLFWKKKPIVVVALDILKNVVSRYLWVLDKYRKQTEMKYLHLAPDREELPCSWPTPRPPDTARVGEEDAFYVI